MTLRHRRTPRLFNVGELIACTLAAAPILGAAVGVLAHFAM